MNRLPVLLLPPLLALMYISAGMGDFEADPTLALSHEILSRTNTSVVFPSDNLNNIAHWESLVAYLSSSLGLPDVNLSRSIVNPTVPGWCCLSDWRNHTVALDQTSVLANSDSGHVILLTYGASGKLSQLAIEGPFGPALPSMDLASAQQRVSDTLANLGITGFTNDFASWNGTGTYIANGSLVKVRTTTIVAYAGLFGLPLAFGNEIRMTFDADRRIAIELTLFPWFLASAPTLTATQAYSRALDYLNATTERTFVNGSAYLAFDSINYELAYQVEAEYAHNGAASNPADYRVWIDPYDGSVTYVAMIPLRPSPPSGSPGSLQLLGWASLVAMALLVGVSLLYIEPLRLAVLAPVVLLYMRLRKDGALDHFVRGQLYAYVAEHPGATFSEIRDAFSLSNGTTTYHLSVLEAIGFLKSRNDGRFKRFFRQEESGKALGQKVSRLQYEILQRSREMGSTTPSDLARDLGISRQRASYNLRRLVDAGLMKEEPGLPGNYSPVAQNEAEIPDSRRE